MATMKDHMGRPVVAVTGIGIVTSLGIGKADNWAALTSGTSGIRSITRFPVEQLSTRISGMVDFLPSSSKGASALTYELAEKAAHEAVAESGFGLEEFGGPMFLASPPMELDWQEGRFFDASGLYLMCATHGAVYAPDSGECVGGPCRGASLAKLRVEERDGQVYWLPEAPYRIAAATDGT